MGCPTHVCICIIYMYMYIHVHACIARQRCTHLYNYCGCEDGMNVLTVHVAMMSSHERSFSLHLPSSSFHSLLHSLHCRPGIQLLTSTGLPRRRSSRSNHPSLLDKGELATPSSQSVLIYTRADSLSPPGSSC